MSVRPLTSDPMRLARAGAVASWAAGLGIAALCTAWAIRVPTIALPPELEKAAEPAAPDGSAPQPRDDFPIEAFALRMAPPPPPPKPAVAPAPAVEPIAPPPPPSRLQLLGIVRDGDSRKAAIYDPVSDAVVVVGEGQQIAGQTVRAVSDRGVELSDGRGVRTLSLKEAAR